MTEGLEVLVQLVMAAISTAPSRSSKLEPSRLTWALPCAAVGAPVLRAARSSAALLALL
jgi:hypothetical protein